LPIRNGGSLLGAIVLALALAGCGNLTSEAGGPPGSGGKGGKGKGGKRGDAAVPVTVAKAVAKDVPVEIRVIGTVEPYSTVSIKPQVAGQLQTAHFHEGEFVRQGQLLFSIDPRTYEAQMRQIEANIARDEAAMRQAQANLSKDRSQEQYARSQAARYEQLAREGIFSKEQNEQMQASAKAAAEAVQADLAAIESAKAQMVANHAALDAQKVMVSYTKIYAPISGRTGAISVKAGNILVAAATELTTINQVQPVYVTFAVPEQNLGAIRQLAGQKLTVHATPEDGSGAQQSGAFAFFDNTVDSSTGTIRLKATFPNENRALWPGQFVRVVLELGRRANAVVTPNQAVQSSQDGPFIYVVKQDRTVEQRAVTPGERLDQEIVIEQGLRPGETVVVEGQLRLVPGARVQIRDGSRPPGGRPGRKQPAPES
jgi:multidrug efflux system membrane fusion protein